MKKTFALFLSFLFLLGLGFAVTELKAETVTGSSIVAYFDGQNQIPIPINGNYGAKLSLSPSVQSGQDFAFWVVNGVVRKDLPPTNQFRLTNNLELKAIYAPTGQYAVAFMDSNGKLLKVDYFDPELEGGDTVTPPSTALLSKPGFQISENPWGEEASFTNIVQHTVYTLQYVKTNVQTYSLAVTNGSSNKGVGIQLYDYNEQATVNAGVAPEGKSFSHWLMDGEIVSISPSYSFTMLQNTSITAVFEDTPFSDFAAVRISGPLTLREGYISFVGQISTKLGYEIVEWGLLSSQFNSDFVLTDDYVTKHQSNVMNSSTSEWLMSLSGTSYMNVKAYVVLEKEGVLSTHYSNLAVNDGSWIEYIDATYNTPSEYNTAVADGWVHAGTNSSSSGYYELKLAGDNIITPDLSSYKGAIKFTFNAWVSSANGTQTFKIEAFDANNVLVESTNNVTLASQGLTSTYKDVSFQFANTNSNIKYIKFTYNKETSGINMRIKEISIFGYGKVLPTSISNIADQEVYVGDAYQASTEILPKLANQNVNWSSSNPSVASVSSNGLVSGISAGTAVITVASVDRASIIDQFTVIVTVVPTYTVSFQSNGGTAVPEQTIFENDLVVQPANPIKTGYTFNGWYPTADFSGPAYVFSTAVTSSFTLYAKFTINQYTISFNSNGGSTLESITQDYGTSITKPADPIQSGFTFVDWYSDSNLTNLFTFSTMPAQDLTLYAKWLSDAPTQNVMIFEVYGGGGNTGAYWKQDYVVLYNPTASAISLVGYSIQYASTTGTSWTVANLTGSIAANSYYLIQLASGTGGTNLPSTKVDMTATNINMGGTGGKIALVNSTTQLSGSNPSSHSSVIDFVGWGSANGYETAAAPATTNTTSIVRKTTTDNNNNSTDFQTKTADASSLDYVPLN